MMSLMAEEGSGPWPGPARVVEGLPNKRRAQRCLYGAWLCGRCSGTVVDGPAPQALPRPRRQLQSAACRDAHDHLAHATAYNAPAAPDAMARVSRALGSDDAVDGLFGLTGKLGAPAALKDIGSRIGDRQGGAGGAR